jgi:2-hydroxychromene-2-carboxylate isomerase
MSGRVLCSPSAARLAHVDFWYEFASTYSYPAAMRIEALAAARGLTVGWRPFLLGPLFAEHGWRDSPFNIYPVKGRYMWRDMRRICDSLDLPLRPPEPFPQNSLLAARIAIALDGEARAEFGEGATISDRATMAALLAAIGADPEATLALAEQGVNKDRLKAECAIARSLGLPGAPCLVTPDTEVFWGNDRLEQGLDWARASRPL